jgi:hypothetical protein
MRLRLEIARLMQKHRLSPPPFTPPPLLSAVEHDVIVEGYAAPDLADREYTRFAWYCWFPIRKEIRLVLKHDLNRPVGRVLETRVDDKGLYVRALVSDDSAKSLSYFCVAATILGWRILHAEDPTRVVALVTSVLDHIATTHRRSQQQKFCSVIGRHLRSSPTTSHALASST